MSFAGRQVYVPQSPAFFNSNATLSMNPILMPPVPNTSVPPPPIGSSFVGQPIGLPSDGQPLTTVFVGNINERAPDSMIQSLLQQCGMVRSWKRVQGATGKPQAFGFCEYENPEATLRCIRLLNGWAIGDKNLLVKVDAKSKTLLDEYKKKRVESSGSKSKKSAKRSGEEGELEDNDDQLDEATVIEDKKIRLNLDRILLDHESALQRNDDSRDTDSPKRVMNERSAITSSAAPIDERFQGRSLEGPKHLTIEDMELDNERRDIVNREIENFRNRHKEDEPRDERDEALRERELQEKREKRRREIERERERRELLETKDREHERRRAALMRRHSSRSPVEGGGTSSFANNDDDEDEVERKRLERKLREKEAAYQERLKNWEARERKKAREYELYMAKENEKRLEEQREGRRLREFLQDYEDERDDEKYYKSEALQRRLKAREREMELDARDRAKEKEELEELRKKLRAEGKPNVEAILAEAEAARDEHLRRRLREHVNGAVVNSTSKLEPVDLLSASSPSSVSRGMLPRLSARAAALAHAPLLSNSAAQEAVVLSALDESDTNSIINPSVVELPNLRDQQQSQVDGPRSTLMTGSTNSTLLSNNHHTNVEAKDTPVLGSGFQFSIGRSTAATVDTANFMAVDHSATAPDDDDSPHASPLRDSSPEADVEPSRSFQNQGFGIMQPRRKKPTLAEVFNQDDDDAESTNKKLVVPFYQPESSTTSSKVLPSFDLRGSESADDKRQYIKKLIDMIPTQKDELFKFPLDWSIVDASLMEKRIKPWVNKKIVEYIGEEEDSLSEFICGKVMSHALPETVLNDIAMVLDEEAEVFVVKMWRLLIYETEAKKAGLVK